MKGLPITLFPHSHLGEQDLKNVLPLFSPLSIFQPWFATPPDFISQKEYQDEVRILNPPSHMKPEQDFKGLLSEYKTWIDHHRDSSLAAFMKASQMTGPAEESSWEILKTLRDSDSAQGGSDKPTQEQDEPRYLKWHLILHLAMDMEQERQEADRILKGLKEGKSPIEDLLGEEVVKNPLRDLSQFDSDPGAVSYPLAQVFDAWFGLFGEQLKEGDLLLTMSRQVLDYASETWDTVVRGNGGKVSPDHGGASQWEPSRGTFQLPHKYFFPFSSQQPLKENKILKYLSGKTMILMEGETRNISERIRK
jgi:hypothetical protein